MIASAAYVQRNEEFTVGANPFMPAEVPFRDLADRLALARDGGEEEGQTFTCANEERSFIFQRDHEIYTKRERHRVCDHK